MTQNEKNFIIENRDFYINGFVDYWFGWNDYIPTEEDIKKEFKNFMYEYKNIKVNLT